MLTVSLRRQRFNSQLRERVCFTVLGGASVLLSFKVWDASYVKDLHQLQIFPQGNIDFYKVRGFFSMYRDGLPSASNLHS